MNSCSCICDNDDYDVLSLHNINFRMSRKQHICCECREQIHVGELYEHVTGLSEKKWFSAKTCLTCCHIRDDLCCSFVYGDLRETLREAIGLDYVTGEDLWENFE